MSVLDMALDMNVVKRKGSWIAFKGESLAQGKEQTMEKLIESPELIAEIEREVMAKVFEANGLAGESSQDSQEDEIFPRESLDEALLEEGAITLDIDAPFPEE
jgi:recombination protein RecA